MISRLLLLLCLILLPTQAWATITVASTTTGSATTAQTFTTASVTVPSGKLMIFFLAWRSTGCFPVFNGGTGDITGLNVDWTLVTNFNVAGGTFNHYVFRAVADGSTGTITGAGNGTNCTTMVWNLIELGGVNTATNQGVVTFTTNNNVTCNNCTVNATWAAYTDANNTQLTSCVMGQDTGATGAFTKDASTGWDSNTLLQTGTGNDHRAIVTEWLITKGSDTSVDCIWSSMAGQGVATVITMEIQIKYVSPKHKVPYSD